MIKELMVLKRSLMILKSYALRFLSVVTFSKNTFTIFKTVSAKSFAKKIQFFCENRDAFRGSFRFRERSKKVFIPTLVLVQWCRVLTIGTRSDIRFVTWWYGWALVLVVLISVSIFIWFDLIWLILADHVKYLLWYRGAFILVGCLHFGLHLSEALVVTLGALVVTLIFTYNSTCSGTEEHSSL
jgi:hypothetical protein